MAGFPWETAAVGLIVGVAAAWAVRSIWRATRRKQVCSTCGSAGDCPLAKARGEGEGEGGAAPCGVGEPFDLVAPGRSSDDRGIS